MLIKSSLIMKLLINLQVILTSHWLTDSKFDTKSWTFAV